MHRLQQEKELNSWTTLEEALWWNRQGVNVLPLQYRSKRPQPGMSWKKWQKKIQGDVLVRSWFSLKYNEANIGVMCGDLIVVDFDSFPAWYAWRPKNGIKETMTAFTGRGVHAYFWIREKFSTTFSFENGDIKGNGYVVAPPSIHPSGRQYRWVGGNLLTISNVNELGVQYRARPTVAVGDYPQGPVISNGSGIIAKIKRGVSIANYLARITGNFQMNGESLMCSCPFHEDKNPSMVIHNKEGWCYCFSPACPAHKKMDVINVAAKFLRVSNSEAIRLLSYEVD